MWHSPVDRSEGNFVRPERSALDLVDDAAVAIAELLAGVLMEIFGPLFWAVLIVGFLYAEFWLD